MESTHRVNLVFGWFAGRAGSGVWPNRGAALIQTSMPPSSPCSDKPVRVHRNMVGNETRLGTVGHTFKWRRLGTVLDNLGFPGKRK